MHNTQRNIRIFLSWLCGQHGISLMPWRKETLAIEKYNGKFTFYVFHDWLYSSDPDIFEILEGGFYHEALGHGRNTDFDAYHRAEKEGLIKWSPLAKGICNIFEDIFIELAASKLYPSVPTALLRTVELLTAKGFFGESDNFDKMGETHCLTTGLLNFCRGKLLPGQDQYLQANMHALVPILQAKLGSVWDQVWEVAKECANSTCTMDNILLTAKVMDIIQSTSKSEPKDESNDDQGSENDKSEGEDSEADAPKSESEQGEEDVDGSEGPTQAEIDAAKAILAGMDDDALEKLGELTEAVNQAIQEAVEQGGGAGGHEIMQMPNQFMDITSDALRVAAVVKSASNDLEELLMSETYTQRECVERGNRMNRSMIVRGASGFTSRIFEKESKADGLSTAIYGLFDFSGSMYSGFMDGCSSGVDAVNGVMYGLGEILDEYEIPYEFAAYSDKFMAFKPFAESGEMLRRGRKAPQISGGTVTGAAVEIGLSHLVQRNEERKLLLVVTDGDTGDLDRLISCYNSAKDMGIEIASVMLGKQVIPSIQRLADETGYKAVVTNKVAGLGRFIVDQIKSAI